MFTAAEIDEFRRDAESRMVDQCEIRRPAGDRQYVGRRYEQGLGEVVYSGICQIMSSSTEVAERAAGDTERAETRLELHLPVVGTESVRRDDVAVITTATHDAALVGLRLVIGRLDLGSQKIKRRLPVTEDLTRRAT